MAAEKNVEDAVGEANLALSSPRKQKLRSGSQAAELVLT
jgi:hypothetical protein